MLARADLEQDPSAERPTGSYTRMSNMGFQWLESRVSLKTAGDEQDAVHEKV